MSQLGEWARQSGASILGSGVFGRGAKVAALKTDRAIRNISNDVWDKVAAEIDSDARQGRYFGCYAVPRSTLGGNSGSIINTGLGKGLQSKGFFTMYCQRPSVGGQLYCDLAVFWGHESRKLFTPSMRSFAFDMMILYLAECVGHGLTTSFCTGQTATKFLAMADLAKANDDNGGAEWFYDNFVKMVAMVAYKPGVPSIMNFHVPEEQSINMLVRSIHGVTNDLFKGKISFDDTGITKELMEYKILFSKDNEDANAQLASGLRLIGQCLLGK